MCSPSAQHSLAGAHEGVSQDSSSISVMTKQHRGVHILIRTTSHFQIPEEKFLKVSKGVSPFIVKQKNIYKDPQDLCLISGSGSSELKFKGIKFHPDGASAWSKRWVCNL